MNPEDGGRSAYAWFATLWPLAVIFHLAGNDWHLLALTSGQLNVVGVLQIPMLMAAAAMVVRPSTITAAGLAISHTLVVAGKLLVVGNHEILLLLIDLLVITGIAVYRDRWIAKVVPPLRWVLLIAYSAFAFSKLNSSFVDHTVSCAVVFADELSGVVNLSVSGSATLATMTIAVVLITELSIPVLLMIRRLRHFAVALGLVFHAIVALEPNGHVFDFTSVLFVLFLLFLTPEVSTKLDGGVERLGRHRRLFLALLGVMIVGNIVGWHVQVSDSYVLTWLFDYPMFLVYAVMLIRTVLRSMRRSEVSPQPLVFPLMAAVVFLTSLNAVSPYVELRTAGAFNMYSNLSVYDGETNHLLLPGTLPLRDAPSLWAPEDDPDRYLDFYLDDQLAVPEINLARWAQNRPNIDLDVRQVRGPDGDIVASVQDLADRSGGFERLASRVFSLRAVDPTHPTACARFWGPAH